MRRRRLLVVDDEDGMLEVCQDTLERLDNVEVTTEGDAHRAAQRLREEPYDLMVTDIRMPGLDGVALLRIAREVDPDLPVLMITGFPTVESAVESLRAGTVDYLVKPFLPDDLLAKVARFLEERRLKQENAVLWRCLWREPDPGEPERADALRPLAASDDVALLLGRGAGARARAARFIHRQGVRRGGRFVPVDCVALPADALLGVKPGLGLLHLADEGILFLDQAQALPRPLQVRLLAALRARAVDARLVLGADLTADALPAAFEPELLALVGARVTLS